MCPAPCHFYLIMRATVNKVINTSLFTQNFDARAENTLEMLQAETHFESIWSIELFLHATVRNQFGITFSIGRYYPLDPRMYFIVLTWK